MPRRLLLQREVRPSGRGEAAVRRALGAKQLVDAGPQVVSPRQGLEVRARQLPLRLRPCDGLWRRRVLQPSVVLGDVEPVVAGGDRDLRRLDARMRGHALSQQPRPEVFNRAHARSGADTFGTRCRKVSRAQGRSVRGLSRDQRALGQPPRIVRITPWGAGAAPETMETCPRSRVLRSGCWSSTTRTRTGVRCRPSSTRPRASPSSGSSPRVRSRWLRRPS